LPKDEEITFDISPRKPLAIAKKTAGPGLVI
jgi:hypothetical protein